MATDTSSYSYDVCLGVLGEFVDDDEAQEWRSLLHPLDEIAIPSGKLYRFPRQRLMLNAATVVQRMRRAGLRRYILTMGEMNHGDRPKVYDLYARFATSFDGTPGEILVSTEVYNLEDNLLRLSHSTEFSPYWIAYAVGEEFIDTPVGTFDSSDRWHSRAAADYLLPYERFDGMTRTIEMPFWRSEAGLIYLAHQELSIRAHGTRCRRIVVFGNSDLGSDEFMLLMHVFDEIGIELFFVHEDDLRAFTSLRGIDEFEVFSRAGESSLLIVGEQTYFSSNRETAQRIAQLQDELTRQPQTIESLAKFLIGFREVLPLSHRSWRRRASAAVKLLREFSARPKAERLILLRTFEDRWRSI